MRLDLKILAASAALATLLAAAAAARPLAAADGPRSDRYKEGQRALSEERWEDAHRAFAALAAEKGAETDAALYWQAWSEGKLGRRADALATLRRLVAEHPRSPWLDDARALELELGGRSAPRGGEDEELKLYALDGLLQAEPDRAVPILVRFLAGDHSLRLKERALFVLAQSDDPRARQALVEVVRSGKPPELRMAAIEQLGLAGGQEDLRELAAIWKDATPDVKHKVLEAWMLADDVEPVAKVARSEPDPSLRRKAIELLGVMGATRELGELYAGEKDREVRGRLLEAYGVAGDVDALTRAANAEPDRELRAKAIESLGVFGGEEGSRALVELYRKETDRGLKERIVEALMINGDAEALVALFRQERDPGLRRKIVQNLALVDDEAAAEFLAGLLEERP